MSILRLSVLANQKKRGPRLNREAPFRSYNLRLLSDQTAHFPLVSLLRTAQGQLIGCLLRSMIRPGQQDSSARSRRRPAEEAQRRSWLSSYWCSCRCRMRRCIPLRCQLHYNLLRDRGPRTEAPGHGRCQKVACMQRGLCKASCCCTDRR